MRAKYRPGDGHTAGNLDTLRKMDARVEGKAQACALTEGIISTLILTLVIRTRTASSGRTERSLRGRAIGLRLIHDRLKIVDPGVQIRIT